jgi:hypothetical protein
VPSRNQRYAVFGCTPCSSAHSLKFTYTPLLLPQPAAVGTPQPRCLALTGGRSALASRILTGGRSALALHILTGEHGEKTAYSTGESEVGR